VTPSPPFVFPFTNLFGRTPRLISVFLVLSVLRCSIFLPLTAPRLTTPHVLRPCHHSLSARLPALSEVAGRSFLSISLKLLWGFFSWTEWLSSLRCFLLFSDCDGAPFFGNTQRFWMPSFSGLAEQPYFLRTYRRGLLSYFRVLTSTVFPPAPEALLRMLSRVWLVLLGQFLLRQSHSGNGVSAGVAPVCSSEVS